MHRVYKFRFCKNVNKKTSAKIFAVDCLTYAANKEIWESYINNERVKTYKVSIGDCKLKKIVKVNNIDCIVNFAAETHVDNSIESPQIFFEANVLGTINLINIAKDMNIRFHQVSTDEVCGDLALDTHNKFEIFTSLNPSSPYSASKAAADLAIIAYGKTYNLNYTISRCGNNYGENQHEEKFIPHSIKLILNGKKIQIYGNGQNVRDWIYVRDHNLAILQILNTTMHKTLIYNIGSENELANLVVAKEICNILGAPDYITFIKDRKAHDRRYAINPISIHEIGWKPITKFSDALEQIIKKYNHQFVNGK